MTPAIVSRHVANWSVSKMIVRRPVAAIALTVVLSLSVDSALGQTAQTAQGAQSFLRELFEDKSKTIGTWLATAGQTRLMDGSTALLLIKVAQLDDRDATGNSNPCVTTIRGLDFSRILLESSGVFYNPQESPLPPFPGVFSTPQFLDWGNASIIRSVGVNSVSTWYVTSASFRMNGSNGPTAAFRMSTQDADLADRIEYAMKFLKMSCEPASTTGF